MTTSTTQPIPTGAPALSYQRIFRFWLPLALTWLMMAVEGPLLAAVIARLADEKANLAAYGIAYAFALIAEAPVIMLLSASTSLCRSAESYRKLRNFSLFLTLAVTLLLAVLLLPVIFFPLAEQLLGLPGDVTRLTHAALLLLLPWPGAIAMRRFYQGVLIASRRTKRIAAATLFRLLSMAGCAFLLYHFRLLDGASLGGLALTCGVVCEALATRFVTRQAIAEVLQKSEQQPPSYQAIWHYYLPLALTPLVALAVHPIVTFFLGRGLFPLESLAVMPVIYGLVFIFRALGLSYQEVAIALLEESADNYIKVRNYAFGLATVLVVCLSLIAFSPLNRIWFETVSGLSPQLAGFALPALQLMAIFPALTVIVSLQRARLIVAKSTRPVSWSSALETVGIVTIMWFGLLQLSLAGVIIASLAYVGGRLMAVTLLQKSLNSNGKTS